MTDRRDFIGRLTLAALAMPGMASAQPARKIYRIGILGTGSPSNMAGPQPAAAPSTRFCVDCASSATSMASTM